MCGIAGIVPYLNKLDIQKILNDLQHRGPDSQSLKIIEEKKLVLGHARLSILDIQDGQQPMSDYNDNYYITYNGEIYNNLNVRQKLLKSGLKFKTSHSDTETLLNSYIMWGENFHEHLDGMWSFAIYDKKKNQLFLSRDRVGEKPLYYYYKNKIFAFSSELNALKNIENLDFEKNELNIQKYFYYGYYPGNKTKYKYIYKLEPGTNLIFDLKNCNLVKNKYWHFKIKENLSISFDESLDLLDELILNSVKKRMITDVKTGFFLSGGLDSSILATYISQIDKNFKAFTIGFEEKSYDESFKAKQLANFLNLNHRIFTLSNKNIIDNSKSILQLIDEPISDTSIVPTYFLCKESRKHIKVAISGDGGDELFGGYDTFIAIKIINQIVDFIPKKYAKYLEKFSNFLPTSHKNMSLDFKIKKFFKGISENKELINSSWMSPMDLNEKLSLFHKKFKKEEIFSEVIDDWNKDQKKSFLNKSLDYYSNFYLPGMVLPKVDRASMLNSLEVRPIFFDEKILNFALSLPSSFKINYLNRKYILKKLLERKIPKKFIDKSKKGFGSPVSSYLKNLEIKNYLIKDNFINNEYIKLKYKKHIKNLSDEKMILWTSLAYNLSK